MALRPIDHSPEAVAQRNKRFRPLHVDNRLLSIGDDLTSPPVPTEQLPEGRTRPGFKFHLAVQLYTTGTPVTDAAELSGLWQNENDIEKDEIVARTAIAIQQKV